MNLTEQQRLNAIASCERIEEINEQMQTNLKNILRILDNCANGRDPEDGIKEYCECDCCGKPGVLARCFVTGIETFACEECRS